MNATTMPALHRTLEFCRDAARAPSNEWPSYARALDTLPKVGASEAGETAMALAALVRSLVRQLPNVPMEADAEIRATLKNLTDVIQTVMAGQFEKPYYADKD